MKKSNKGNLIICGVAFIFMIVYVYFVDGFDNIVESLQQISVGFLFISVICMFLYWLLEAMSLHLVTKAIYPKQKFKNTLVISMLGQYFNCITPSSTGGQPMQAYYLMKCGASLSTAMTALLCKFIVYQFTLTAYSIVVLLMRFNYFTQDLGPLMILVVVGFVINTMVIIGLLMLAFFKNFVIKVADWIIKLLGKMRIVKNVEERTEFLNEQLEEYHANFQFIKTQPVLIMKMFVLTAIQLTIYFSISYIIYLGFHLTGTDFLTIISCQAFVLMISAFMPLPGALGAAEGSYTAFFSKIFVKGANSFVGVSTFIWRFLTFYLPIIAGLILSLFVNRILTGTKEKISFKTALNEKIPDVTNEDKKAAIKEMEAAIKQNKTK